MTQALTPIIYAVSEYHPVNKNGMRNPLFNSSISSKKILDLKDPTNTQHKAAVQFFIGRLNTFLTKNSIKLNDFNLATIVPSSTAGQYSAGVYAVINTICNGIIPVKPTLLVRQMSIQAMHNGGIRSPNTHVSSIVIHPALMNKGDRILLLDDVTTSGGSFEGCSSLLFGAGASKVVCIAMGQTV